jgi:hypothetical protein
MTWEQYNYQLALIFILMRAMPAPPSIKDKEGRIVWERMMENAVRAPARELLKNRPKATPEEPLPTDPTDILTDDRAEAMWQNFIDYLNAKQPLRSGDGTHKSFLGSIEHYRQIFMAANEQTTF